MAIKPLSGDYLPNLMEDVVENVLNIIKNYLAKINAVQNQLKNNVTKKNKKYVFVVNKINAIMKQQMIVAVKKIIKIK